MLDVKKLLTKILGDTSWKTLTSSIKYRQRAGFITLRIYGTFSLTTSWSSQGTLPTGYRPTEDVYFPCTTITNNSNIIGVVTSGGALSLRLGTGATSTTYSVETIVTFPI